MDCPYWVAGPQSGPGETSLLTSGAPVKLNQFFNQRKKEIKVTGTRSQGFMAQWFTGKAEVSWELTLRRKR
jgi:hypothetical protein